MRNPPVPIIDWLKAKAKKLWHWITGRKPLSPEAKQYRKEFIAAMESEARLKARKPNA